MAIQKTIITVMNREKAEKRVELLINEHAFSVFRNVFDLNILMKIKTKWVLSLKKFWSPVSRISNP